MSEQPKQVTLEEAVRVAGVGKFLGGRKVLVSDYAEMVELQGDMGRQGLMRDPVSTRAEELDEGIIIHFDRDVFDVKFYERPPLDPSILEFYKKMRGE